MEFVGADSINQYQFLWLQCLQCYQVQGHLPDQKTKQVPVHSSDFTGVGTQDRGALCLRIVDTRGISWSSLGDLVPHRILRVKSKFTDLFICDQAILFTRKKFLVLTASTAFILQN